MACPYSRMACYVSVVNTWWLQVHVCLDWNQRTRHWILVSACVCFHFCGRACACGTFLNAVFDLSSKVYSYVYLNQAWELYVVRRKCARPLTPVHQTACPSTLNPSQSSKMVLYSSGRISHLAHSGNAESQAQVPATICKVKCPLHTRFGMFLCKTSEHGPPGRTLFNAGTVFQMTGVILGEPGQRKVARTTRYGEWTPPLYAYPNHFLQFPCLLNGWCLVWGWHLTVLIYRYMYCTGWFWVDLGIKMVLVFRCNRTSWWHLGFCENVVLSCLVYISHAFPTTFCASCYFEENGFID